MPSISAAAYAFLDGLAPDDEVALVSYSQSPQAILPFTADKSALAAALSQIQYTLGMGDLNFYDSVSTVLDWIAPLHGKKAIVLLTTGLDSSPPERWDALAQKLRKDDTVLFAVALGGSLRHPAERKEKEIKSHAKSRTRQTNHQTRNLCESRFGAIISSKNHRRTRLLSRVAE